MDVFGYIPNDMIEAFDVVHIRRAFALVVHSNPMSLFENLVSMLSKCLPFLDYYLSFSSAS